MLHALVMNASLKSVMKKGLKRKSCSYVMHLLLYSFMSLPGFNWMYTYFHLSCFVFSCVTDNSEMMKTILFCL